MYYTQINKEFCASSWKLTKEFEVPILGLKWSIYCSV